LEAFWFVLDLLFEKFNAQAFVENCVSPSADLSLPEGDHCRHCIDMVFIPEIAIVVGYVQLSRHYTDILGKLVEPWHEFYAVRAAWHVEQNNCWFTGFDNFFSELLLDHIYDHRDLTSFSKHLLRKLEDSVCSSVSVN